MASNPRVLIDDGVFDPGISPDPNPRPALGFILGDGFRRFVKVIPHHDGSFEVTPLFDHAANAEQAMAERRMVDDAAVRDEGVLEVSAVDL